MKNLFFYGSVFTIASMLGLSAHAQNARNLNLKDFTSFDYQVVSQANLFSAIDFYNSNVLTLTRELRSDEVGASKGILRFTNNRRYEDVILPLRNVGQFHSVMSNGSIRVSFDARSANRTFTFVPSRGSDGKTEYFIDSTIDSYGQVIVQYAGEEYIAVLSNNENEAGFDLAGNARVHLLFDKVCQQNKQMTSDTLKSFPSRRDQQQ